MINKLNRTILSFVCLIFAICSLFILCGCKDENGNKKSKPSSNEARALCVEAIEKENNGFYIIQTFESNVNVEPNTYYFLVYFYPNRTGATLKTYMYIVSYEKNEKNYYEPKVETRLLN